MAKTATAKLVKRKNDPKVEKLTFPALYKHRDGCVYLFTAQEVAICLIDDTGFASLGAKIGSHSPDGGYVDCAAIDPATGDPWWSRLPPNYAVKIYNQ